MKGNIKNIKVMSEEEIKNEMVLTDREWVMVAGFEEGFEALLSEYGLAALIADVQERAMSKSIEIAEEHPDWDVDRIINVAIRQTQDCIVEDCQYGSSDEDDPWTCLGNYVYDWLSDDYQHPEEEEQKEELLDRGLIKEGWLRLTSHGIVGKSWDDEDWWD